MERLAKSNTFHGQNESLSYRDSDGMNRQFIL